ncbi:MAG: hypothetical protein C4297_09460 [Gemmataceae bacterium]
MKGFCPLLGWLFVSAAGCTYSYSTLVDPCWPQRYVAEARHKASVPFRGQADNGLYLEQTVWNHHFRPGTSELTPAGRELLERLARRRPQPIERVFVQAAHDVPVAEAAAPAAAERAKLDAQRVQAVSAYLARVRPDVSFQVSVHDPAPVGMSSQEALPVIRSMQSSGTGRMTGSAPASSMPAGSSGEHSSSSRTSGYERSQ